MRNVWPLVIIEVISTVNIHGCGYDGTGNAGVEYS
jgi:hypothetical protein